MLTGLPRRKLLGSGLQGAAAITDVSLKSDAVTSTAWASFAPNSSSGRMGLLCSMPWAFLSSESSKFLYPENNILRVTVATGRRVHVIGDPYRGTGSYNYALCATSANSPASPLLVDEPAFVPTCLVGSNVRMIPGSHAS